MEQDLADFFATGYLNPEQADMLHTAICDLLNDLRPDAVPLVDSFNFSDYVLNSSLGRYDGQVYESLFEYARRPENPLNQSDVPDGIKEFISPLIRGEAGNRLTAEGSRHPAKL